MIQNKMKHYRLLQNKPVCWIILVSTFTEFLTTVPITSRLFTCYIANSLKSAYWLHFALVVFLAHIQASKFWRKKRFKTLQSKEITFQVFGGKPPCHMTIRTGFGFQHRRFSGFSHSLLQVAVRLLWRSAHMSPIGACGFETNEHQLAPEVTKGCNMSRNSSIRVCVVIGFVIVFSSSTIQTTQVRWSTRC